MLQRVSHVYFLYERERVFSVNAGSRKLILNFNSATRKRFSQALSTFIPFLSQTSLDIANRLEMSQRQHDFHEKPITAVNGETTDGPAIEVAAMQLEAVIDLPIVNARAGLYVFLNALVCYMFISMQKLITDLVVNRTATDQ